jgi:hypothetical protein
MPRYYMHLVDSVDILLDPKGIEAAFKAIPAKIPRRETALQVTLEMAEWTFATGSMFTTRMTGSPTASCLRMRSNWCDRPLRKCRPHEP